MDDPIPSHGQCHDEESVLFRLHIIYTFLSHFYLLKGEEPLVCIPGNEVLSVERSFINCVDLQQYRNCFKSCSLKLLLREYSLDNIVEF